MIYRTQISKNRTRKRRREFQPSTVSVLEVKRAFILANSTGEMCRSFSIVSFDDLKKVHDGFSKKIEESKQVEIDRGIEFKRRVDLYEQLTWRKGEVDLGEAGVWPEMRGIHIDLCYGPVIDTADRIRKIGENPEKGLTSKLLESLRSINEKGDYIRDKFPLIVVPGGEIRYKGYNLYHEELGIPIIELDFMKHDIEDGSTRAIAYALSGLREVPAYIGEYVNGKSYNLSG